MATQKTITATPRGDRKAPFRLMTPDSADPFAGIGAWNDLDHALRQLNYINDIAMELQPEIRKLAPDGQWCADRLGFINGAFSDYVQSAREALDMLKAEAYGKATAKDAA